MESEPLAMASRMEVLMDEMSAARQLGIGTALTEGRRGVEVWWPEAWRRVTRGDQWAGWW